MDESARQAARGAAIKHIHSAAAVDECPVSGRYRAQRPVHPGEQEAIVSRELWREVNTRLKLNRAKTRSNARVETLLENLVTCGECGSLLTASFTRRQGQRHVYYVCRAGKKREPACPQQPVAAFDLDRSLGERFEHMGRMCADSLQLHQLIRTLSYHSGTRRVCVELRDGSRFDYVLPVPGTPGRGSESREAVVSGTPPTHQSFAGAGSPV